MDLGIFSWSNFGFSSLDDAKTKLLSDVVNFLTNPAYNQSQNVFFNVSGNEINRSDHCYNGWSVHDNNAGSHEVVIKCPYPTAMGANKFCYVRIGTNSSTPDNGFTNNISLVFDVAEYWDSTLHTGVNCSGIKNNYTPQYGFNVLPQYGSSQKLVLGASVYGIMCHLQGHPSFSMTRWFGYGSFYNSDSGAEGGFLHNAPLFVGILPYAEGSGWHTSASNYPATFCSMNPGNGVHPFGGMAFPRLKGISGDVVSVLEAYAAAEREVVSTRNNPVGLPTTTVPGAGGSPCNSLFPMTPFHPTLGIRFENASFNFSELFGGVYMACAKTGLPYDVIIDSSNKQYKLFPAGSDNVNGNTCLMIAVRIN